MKNIVESWRGYVNEQEQEDADEEQVSSNEIENVGQLRTALRNYKIKKTGGKLLTKILKKGVEMAPVIGPGLARLWDAGELGMSLYGGDLDKKAPLPGLAAMRVDPDVSKIVDDDIEKEFLKVLSQELEEADPETPIDDFNTTGRLQNFIASKFNQTTVKKESTEKDLEDLEKKMSDLEKDIDKKKKQYSDFSSHAKKIIGKER
tara:strand:- start:328 stop:939 length:612 start_codon:yes stop_codon:yes gene_type:complete